MGQFDDVAWCDVLGERPTPAIKNNPWFNHLGNKTRTQDITRMHDACESMDPGDFHIKCIPNEEPDPLVNQNSV